MAEESDLEKTEPASPRRLEQAREEGDVPRSRELATCAVLIVSCGSLWFMGGNLVREMNRMLTSGLSLSRAEVFDFNLLVAHMAVNLQEVVIAFAPMAIAILVAAAASPALIGGWLFSAKALQPNFGRMNPMKGLGNMVSARAGVELLKAIIKALLVGLLAWFVVRAQLDTVLGLGVEPVKSGSAHLASTLLVAFVSIAGGLILIAAMDVPYQLWHYANKLKMTKEEVRQESKESDGNPEIKGKIRQLQREMAKRRMMAEVPTADVVVTNPTHFSVALKYTEGKMRAPVVIAKGADDVAFKIREIAAEHNIPTLEAPPLARALYRHTDLGETIPEALYTAVAEVLAYVFQLRAYKEHGGERPQAPNELEVPAELDPLNPASRQATDTRTIQ